MNKIQIKLMIRQRKTYASRKWGLGGSVGEDFFFFLFFLPPAFVCFALTLLSWEEEQWGWMCGGMGVVVGRWGGGMGVGGGGNQA